MKVSAPISKSILQSANIRQNEHLQTTYRLVRHFLCAEDRDAYSFFLTTVHHQKIEEEFLFDLTENEKIATCFFEILCQNHVTACTLFEIAEDFLGTTDKHQAQEIGMGNILK